MADPYSGQPRRLIMTNAPICEITDSDCDSRLIPETVSLGNQVLAKADEDHSRFWRETVATYVMHEGKFWSGLKPTAVFALSRFPDGYELYVSTRGDNERFDFYLYGFKSDGTHWKFTSPADFVMHAKWLAFGRPKGACGCQYCSGASQLEIKKRLKAVTKRVKMPSIVSAQSKGSKKRKAPTAIPSRPQKRKILEKVEIQMKDYTGGSSTVSQIHKLRLQGAKINHEIQELEKSRKSEQPFSNNEDS